MPEMIVKKWDGPYSYMVFFERGLYRARRGDTAEVPFEDPSASVVIQQAVNSLLHGGTIFLKEVQLPNDVTFGSNILIVEDYQGERTFYSNNKKFNYTEETASYIVFMEDGVVKAKNGHTGQVEFKGEDAAAIIQAAVNATNAAGGGKVFIKAGSYEIKSSIVMKSYVMLEGELESYKGELTAGGTSLLLGSGVDGIVAESGAYAFGLRNLHIDGQDISGRGIMFVNVGAINIKNVGVVRTNDEGIRLQVWDSLIQDVEVEFCNSYGWYIGRSSNTLWIHCTGWGNLYDQWLITADHGRSAFIQCRAGRFNENEGLSGFLMNDATRVHLISPMIENMKYDGIRLYGSRYCEIISPAIYNIGRAADNTYYGIYIYPSSNYNSTHNLIIGGMLDNSEVSEQPKYGVYEADANQDYNYIVGFKVLSAATAKYLLQGAHSKVMLDPFFITKNSGTATIPNGSSTVTVNHGLAAAPSVVKLTGTHSEVKDCWVTNPTATQFTINAPAAVTADRDVYWQAEV